VVLDPTGAAMSNATIQAQDLSTHLLLQTISTRNGDFVLPSAPAGEYQLTISASGFSRIVLPKILVQVGAVTDIQAHLKIAWTSETTNEATNKNRSSTGLDQPSTTTLSITIADIDRLPVDGRQWQDVSLWTSATNSNENKDLFSFRGLPVTQNSSRIDGASDDQSFSAVPRGTGAETNGEPEEQAIQTPGANSRHRIGAAYTFSQEAVREFRVNSQNYSALYGHALGGVVTTISKSGTNALHGTAFYLARDSAWDAANPFSIDTNYVNGTVTSATVKPHDLRQQFGGSAGGPIMRDKLFYFYALDQQRRNFPAISTPTDPSFYSLTATQTALLANRGVTTTKINAALTYLNSLTGTVPRRSDQTINFGKLDWQASAKNHISLQYNRARSSAPAALRLAPVIDRGAASLGTSFARVDGVMGRWVWMPRPRLTNQVSLQYSRDFQFDQAQQPLPQEPAVGPGGYAPEVSIGPQGLIFGTPATLGLKAFPDERRVEVGDMVTWVHGGHVVRVGAEFSAVHDLTDSLSNAEGTFRYDSGATGGHSGGLVDWITDYTFNVNAYPNGGCPSIHSAVHDFCFRSFTQSFGEQSVTFHTQEWSAFLQDDWRVRAGLTVNAGLRYEYELLPFPQQPNAALDAVFGKTGATSVFPEDRNNFGPRVGVAWEPFGAGQGVVHVGYGLYFGRLPGATIRSALANTALASSTVNVRIVPDTVTVCPQVANQGFGYACSYLTTPPAAVGATTSAMVFDRRFRLPTVQQGSLSVEREVRFGVLGSATYLMNLDRQLPNSVDINIAPSLAMGTFQIQGGPGIPGFRDGETFTIPVYTQRVNANYGPVTDIVSNANASYNALVLEARSRGRRGLEFHVSWTWAKTIDYGQNNGATPRINGQFDPFTAQYDKGLSALNFPHKVSASAVWEPRFAPERRWLRTAANGWQIASLFTERSGGPYSYDIFGGTRLSGGRESINGSGGAVYLPTVGRNTLRLPDAYNVDLRMSRTLRVTDAVRVRGTAEVFNLTNHVNYSGVTQRAFLVSAAVNGVTPLVFQDAATVAAEGLNTRPFGAFTGAATGSTQERL
ncbi:MAG TPA: TonB-dependent receptor, partial [Terriglobales bacterium]|nr:TonB-dependent receptor [Terriglobales bacterium]